MESAGRITGMFGNLGRALLRLRKIRGQSLTALARKAGVGKSQLSKYERGKELPKLESLERLLTALGADYFELFRVLAAIDRGEDLGRASTPEDVDACFSKLTERIFALHREVVKELCHG